ncbi:MAG: c-type cytochrome [Pseudomonadota bacterium]
MASNRTRLMLKTAAATLAASLLLVVSIGLVIWRSGWYNVGAIRQHWQAVHAFLELGMHHSVRNRAGGIAVPVLDTPRRIASGARIYRDNCVQCHGAPGVAQADFGKSMQPVPGPLMDVARRWTPAELYWITRNGIKMSGMPAWEFHLDEDELWSLVAFMQKLPAMAPPEYARFAAAQPQVANGERAGAQVRAIGDAARGRVALGQYACNACHMIPGVTGPRVYVGRPLDGVGSRKFIAGHLPNSQASMVRWMRDPQGVDPQTAMPDLDVTEADAIDISTYLMTLR